MAKLLSIIVPVYNIAHYLENCLISLCNQNISADEYEILCIDDGSTDDSAKIIERMMQKYSNIRVITQTNGGVSKARNLGIDNACGKYLFFATVMIF